MHLNDQQYRKVMRDGWNLTPDVYGRVWTPVLREYSIGCLDPVSYTHLTLPTTPYV